MFRRILLGMALLFTGSTSALAQALPERTQWRATSSAPTQQTMLPANAIDGDVSTRWGGPFSPGHWFQVDLGRSAGIGGAIIHWDSAFAVAYYVQASLDGERWNTVYQTADSPGGVEYLGFPAVTARYLRVASVPTTADWGVNIYEFEPLATNSAPRVEGHDELLSMTHAEGIEVGEVVRVRTPSRRPVSGLEVFWRSARGAVRLEGRDGQGAWRLIAEDPEGEGDRSFLAASEAQVFTEMRLSIAMIDGRPPQVARMRMLGPGQVMTPMRHYQIAAEGRHRDLFPDSLRARQVYWTVVGAPAAVSKTILSEWGDVEAFKGAPLVQAIWRDDDGAFAAYGREVEHGLRRGWMPMPWMRWSPHAGVTVQTDAVAQDGPNTWVRYRVTNSTGEDLNGQLALLVRPVQVSPPWQNGGFSPIARIELSGAPQRTSVEVNRRPLMVSVTPVSARGASPFGAHGESEITRFTALGRTPGADVAEDARGMAAAMLRYDMSLPAGASQDVIVVFPLGEVAPGALPGGFDALAESNAAEWEARLGRIGVHLPDESLVNMLRAQAAYMLLNQSGHALQPGPRNYDRSFIRDGSATAAILLRMGETQTARDYLRWYAAHAVHENGLVSPILNADGSVNDGFGADLEHDSQGEFIWLVAEVARLDGGPQTVRDYRDEVVRAMRFIQELRERTLAPGYLAHLPAPERFRGILAPSISHEGYSTPTHSYWDDYWALKGWLDGAWLTRAWGDEETADWALQQYDLLRDSVARSIETTMQWRGIDTIPSSADLGDPDPTGVSIGLDPTGQQAVMPADAVRRTFEGYLSDVRQRQDAAANYAYTPYELRNVLTLVRLNRPNEAAELLEHFLAGRQPAAWQVLAEVVNSDVRRPIYLGDMPHTWIGSEYARAIFGMLMHEGDEALELLPGAPAAWLADGGLRVEALPTAQGALTMQAVRRENVMTVNLGSGLNPDTPVRVFWPTRERPRSVVVDGRRVREYDQDSVSLRRPFRRLVARW